MPQSKEDWLIPTPFEGIPRDYLHEHKLPTERIVDIDDPSFGVDFPPERLDLPDDVEMVRAILDIDPHNGGFYLAVVQRRRPSGDSSIVQVFRLDQYENTFTCPKRPLTYLEPDVVTFFGRKPGVCADSSQSTMQLEGVSEDVSNVHLGLRIISSDGRLTAIDKSENNTWQLTLDLESLSY